MPHTEKTHNLKNSTKQNLILGGTLVLIIIAIGTITFFYSSYKNTLTSYQKEYQEKITFEKKIENLKIEIDELKKEKKESFVNIYKEDLLKDLTHNYQNVSNRIKRIILDTILEESERYNINPLILYSLCYVESTFRHWLEHEERVIEININNTTKKIKIRAVGITGVIWEVWGDKLKTAGIAETRGDLFDPVINIRAGAFIYNEGYEKSMKENAKNKDESALLRFFGGNFPIYVERINNKIGDIVKPKLFRKE